MSTTGRSEAHSSGPKAMASGVASMKTQSSARNRRDFEIMCLPSGDCGGCAIGLVDVFRLFHMFHLIERGLGWWQVAFKGVGEVLKNVSLDGSSPYPNLPRVDSKGSEQLRN